MLQDSATILEACLSEIAAGKATTQECLERHPDQAGELEPLLRAAEGARAIDKPNLTPAARARIEARLLAATESVPPVQPARSSYPTIALTWRWAAVGLAVLFACASLLGAGLVTAAGDAPPDSQFYPVKLATEDVWLWLAPVQDEPALHLHFAQRRLDEAQALAKRGRFDAVVLTALTEETTAALDGAETLSLEAAEPVLQEALRVTAEQERVLSALIARAPARERGEFVRTLQASSVHRARALQLLGTLRPPEGPGDSGQTTPAPIPTLPIGITASPSWTPEPSCTSVPSSTPTTADESEVPAETPQPTATPTPGATVRPTEAPRPTETAKLTPTSIPPSVTATTAPPTTIAESQGCVYGLGYWKNHPDVWPANSLALGSETYTQAELLELLNRPTKGDASLILAQQLIAAKLNVANGAGNSTIAATIAAADIKLANYAGKLPYDVKPSLPEGQEVVALADMLEQYNSGILPSGPPNCP